MEPLLQNHGSRAHLFEVVEAGLPFLGVREVGHLGAPAEPRDDGDVGNSVDHGAPHVLDEAEGDDQEAGDPAQNQGR